MEIASALVGRIQVAVLKTATILGMTRMGSLPAAAGTQGEGENDARREADGPVLAALAAVVGGE